MKKNLYVSASAFWLCVVKMNVSKISGLGQRLQRLIKLPNVLNLLIKGAFMVDLIIDVFIPKLQQHIEDIEAKANNEYIQNEPNN